MTQLIADHLEQIAVLARDWGPLLILLFMAIESSLIPFPSEVVMIPAGFLAARHELFPGEPLPSAALAVACGVLGSLAGAYFNYFLALKLGRPILHRHSRWFFLTPGKLDRAEEIFREYGEVATFVCRLLPGIRQLISIPAGLSRMNFARFSFFTGLGAGIWVLVLTGIGYHFGNRAKDMTYVELLERGQTLISDHLLWILLACLVILMTYVYVHRRIIHGRKS